MPLAGRFIDGLISLLVHALCRLDDQDLSRVPMKGPLLLVTNHINFLEIPVLHSRMQPRHLIGFAKAEAWDSKFIGWLFDYWDAIPVRRGEGDIGALRQTLDVLKKDGIVVIAPEGTRSGDGKLRQGHPGAAIMALKSGAPILPLVFYGGETFHQNLRRLRRTPFHVVVGEPFHLTTGGEKTTSEMRQRIADQIMYQIAALLPADYRGVYSDLEKAEETYLQFESPEKSNLKRV